MNDINDEKEIDDFFAWLAPRIIKPELTSVPPPPSFELLRLIKESVAKTNDTVAINKGFLEYPPLNLMAADDGSLQQGAVRIVQEKYELTRETIPEDPNWQILKFKWTEQLTLNQMIGLKVELKIGEELFDLGTISPRGIAEAEVPSGLDLSKAIPCIEQPN